MIGLSLYSGVGGMDLAAHWSGIQTVAMCETDEYNRSVLRRHWPDVPIFEEDSIVTDESLCERVAGWGGADIIFGGPPCQPFSVAGLRRAEEDPRHRWPTMARIVDELRPSFVVVENVAGFEDVAQRIVRPELESIGYSTVRFDIPAAASGQSNPRMRIFVVAYTDVSGRKERRKREPKGAAERAAECGGSVSGMANAKSSGRGFGRKCRAGSEISAFGDCGSVGDADERGRGIERTETERAGVGPKPQRASEGMADADSERRSQSEGGEPEQRRRALDGSESGMVNSANIGSKEGVEHEAGPEIGRSARRDHDGGSARTPESRLERVSDRVTARMDAALWPAPRLIGIDANGNTVTLPSQQHEWEPPRTTTERELRRKRLKAIGNICSPHQAYPIFAFIVEIYALLRSAIQTV